MRILYDSKNTKFKSKFGTLRENEGCKFNIHIPKNCKTVDVKLIFLKEDCAEYSSYTMFKANEYEGYEIYSCDVSFASSALLFYYFRITTESECFSLYKQGYDMTNMEEGELWQLSVVPSSFSVPKQYKGCIMYQIFPDRFCRKGEVDLSEKLKPYFIHENTREIPNFMPDENGIVQNNDFFGGNLQGIISKLDYLRELNVDVIYLNPIFKAFSNHRYDTADYMKIDEMLGDENDFSLLCEEAHARGMKIILDGVFSHTGSNSIYFDSEKIFGNGAVSSSDSPYKDWFDFKNYPDEYTSWWGIKTLPCVNENDKGYRDFIINNQDSVIAHWLNLGADGFRLDVADELPDDFILELRNRMKGIKKDSLLIGEVWEDASNKISYNQRRKYFTDAELDSVMNYPFRNAIIDYCLGNDNGFSLRDCVMTVAENYPDDVLHSLMNIISTHDTVRILTSLGVENVPQNKNQRAEYKMDEYELSKAKEKLFIAIFLQFVLPGMPCIYYGDEIGTEGFEDPFCRTFFEWDKIQNNDVLDFYKSVTSIKRKNDALKYGSVDISVIKDGVVSIKRAFDDKFVEAIINMSDEFVEVACVDNYVISQKIDIDNSKIYIKKHGFILKV